MNVLKLFISQHKLAAGILGLVLIAGAYAGYEKFFTAAVSPQYAFAKVSKGTLVVSLAGSGQVAALESIDVKPKVSGTLVYASAKNGQKVDSGELIAEIDPSSEKKSVLDAESNLESAQLALEKLKKPADSLSLLQAQNTLLAAQDAKTKAESDLKKAYDDGFTDVSQDFLDLPNTINGLNDIFFASNIDTYQAGTQNIDWYFNQVSSYPEGIEVDQYKRNLEDAYKNASDKYADAFADYKKANRSSDPATIEALIKKSYDATKIASEAVKDGTGYINLVQDILKKHNRTIPSPVTTHLASLGTYTSTTDKSVASLLAATQTIRDTKNAIDADLRSIDEKKASLAKLQGGTDPLDIRAQELTVRERENALNTAKDALNDYYVRAPFAGLLTKADLHEGQEVAPGTAIATIITSQKIAQISLNEVDIAKIKVGDKTTLTFDAVPDISLTGQVRDIDAVGTVSQGVVTYGVKISFDTEDERIKPGMSVSAAIVTDTKTNVLLIPNAAVKTQNNATYVEVPAAADTAEAQAATMAVSLNNAPERKNIETGESNDEFTEVTGGLKEGDIIIARTIQPSQSAASTQQRSLLQIPGAGGGLRGGGGAVRTGAGGR